MTARRFATVLALLGALTLLGLAAACGDNGESPEGADASSAESESVLDQSREQVGEMITAAEQGDLENAREHFEAGHDALHEVIEGLEAGNPELAEELDLAVDDAEKDFEEGSDADHIVEIGTEIQELLAQAE